MWGKQERSSRAAAFICPANFPSWNTTPGPCSKPENPFHSNRAFYHQNHRWKRGWGFLEGGKKKELNQIFRRKGLCSGGGEGYFIRTVAKLSFSVGPLLIANYPKRRNCCRLPKSSFFSSLFGSWCLLFSDAFADIWQRFKRPVRDVSKSDLQR